MRRETRLNLLWIVVLIALMLPGAVIIFRKKFKPGEQPMSFREPVRTSAVFMDPSGFPPGFQRVVPRRTADWVAGLLRDELGASVEMLLVEQGGTRTPVVSSSRRVQLAGWSGNTSRRAVLLVWDDTAPDDVSISGEDSSPVAQVSRRGVALPREISLELRDAGYVRPPKQVTVLVMDVPTSWSRLLVRLGASSDLLELPPGH
jgi:hypothetical protein